MPRDRNRTPSRRIFTRAILVLVAPVLVIAVSYVLVSGADPGIRTADAVSPAHAAATRPRRGPWVNRRLRRASRPVLLYLLTGLRRQWRRAREMPQPRDMRDMVAPALAYLAAHSAPGFVLECPGNALGHQAMTCVNVAGVCPGQRLITISDPCPAAYHNEAWNSWVLLGLRQAPIDPYGHCT